MSNESLISLPPNLSDEVVLKRVLSLIIENLDIAVGNKQSPNSLFNTQQDLLQQTKDISNRLEQANSLLDSKIDEVISDEELQNTVNELQNSVLYSNFLLSFTPVTVNGDVNIHKSKNVSSLERIDVGRYVCETSLTNLGLTYFMSSYPVKITNSSGTLTIEIYTGYDMHDPDFNIDIVGFYETK